MTEEVGGDPYPLEMVAHVARQLGTTELPPDHLVRIRLFQILETALKCPASLVAYLDVLWAVGADHAQAVTGG